MMKLLLLSALLAAVAVELSYQASLSARDPLTKITFLPPPPEGFAPSMPVSKRQGSIDFGVSTGPGGTTGTFSGHYKTGGGTTFSGSISHGTDSGTSAGFKVSIPIGGQGAIDFDVSTGPGGTTGTFGGHYTTDGGATFSGSASYGPGGATGQVGASYTSDGGATFSGSAGYGSQTGPFVGVEINIPFGG